EKTFIMEVTAVETKGDTRFATIAFLTDNKVTGTERIAVSGKGVLRDQINGEVVEPPICILRYPYKPGEKWKLDSRVEALAHYYKQSVTAHEAEQIEVPAGRYVAVRVESKGPPPPVPPTGSTQFAPDVGIVNIKYPVNGANDIVWELKSFIPGKE